MKRRWIGPCIRSYIGQQSPPHPIYESLLRCLCGDGERPISIDHIFGRLMVRRGRTRRGRRCEASVRSASRSGQLPKVLDDLFASAAATEFAYEMSRTRLEYLQGSDLLLKT